MSIRQRARDLWHWATKPTDEETALEELREEHQRLRSLLDSVGISGSISVYLDRGMQQIRVGDDVWEVSTVERSTEYNLAGTLERLTITAFRGADPEEP